MMVCWFTPQKFETTVTVKRKQTTSIEISYKQVNTVNALWKSFFFHFVTKLVKPNIVILFMTETVKTQNSLYIEKMTQTVTPGIRNVKINYRCTLNIYCCIQKSILWKCLLKLCIKMVVDFILSFCPENGGCSKCRTRREIASGHYPNREAWSREM